jgi:hypothetical protein
LAFLGAYTSAHGGERAGFFQHYGCLAEASAFYVFDESGYVDSYRASCDALRVGTVEATCCFGNSLFAREATVYLFVTGDSVGRVEFRHFYAWCGRAFFCGTGFAKLFAPLGFTG